MEGWVKAKAIGITTLSVISRAVYNGGGTLYCMQKVGDYFKLTGHPAATAMTSVAVSGSVGSTLLGKTVTTYESTSTSSSLTQPVSPLSWGGWLVTNTLKTSAQLYGGLSSLNAYFLTTLISKALDSLLSSEPNTLAWKEALTQIGAVLVAGLTYYNYQANDYRFIKENIQIIGESIDARQYTLNSAMAKTLVASSLNLFTYPAQAYFFSKPSFSSIPYLGDALDDTGKNVLTGVACGVTFMTVVTWMPSVYKHFTSSESDANARQRALIPSNGLTTSYKIASYTTGIIDSVGGNGLGPFISMITVLSEGFGLNPYGWIIGFAALCGLNAMFMNLLFSVKAGCDTSLEIIYQDSDASVTRPLLRAEDSTQDRRFYTESATRTGGLLFPSASPGTVEQGFGRSAAPASTNMNLT